MHPPTGDIPYPGFNMNDFSQRDPVFLASKWTALRGEIEIAVSNYSKSGSQNPNIKDFCVDKTGRVKHYLAYICHHLLDKLMSVVKALPTAASVSVGLPLHLTGPNIAHSLLSAPLMLPPLLPATPPTRSLISQMILTRELPQPLPADLAMLQQSPSSALQSISIMSSMPRVPIGGCGRSSSSANAGLVVLDGADELPTIPPPINHGNHLSRRQSRAIAISSLSTVLKDIQKDNRTFMKKNLKLQKLMLTAMTQQPRKRRRAEVKEECSDESSDSDDSESSSDDDLWRLIEA